MPYLMYVLLSFNFKTINPLELISGEDSTPVLGSGTIKLAHQRFSSRSATIRRPVDQKAAHYFICAFQNLKNRPQPEQGASEVMMNDVLLFRRWFQITSCCTLDQILYKVPT